MGNATKCVSPLVAIFGLILSPEIYAQAPKPPDTPPSQGTRIGTIIKDASDVALPNTTKLIQAIFGTSNTARKPEATAAVKGQADASAQAANAKLKDISVIATELNVVSEYLEQSVPAS